MSRPEPGPLTTDQLMRTFSAAAEEGRHHLEASFQTCAAEMAAFFDDLAKDNAEATSQMAKCRTPLELLAIQQKWLAGWAEACVTAGARMCLGALHEPEAAAAEVGEWRLPE